MSSGGITSLGQISKGTNLMKTSKQIRKFSAPRNPKERCFQLLLFQRVAFTRKWREGTGPFHGSKAFPLFEAQSLEFHLLILEGGQEGRDGSWLNRTRGSSIHLQWAYESDLFKTRPNIMPPWKPSPSWEQAAHWTIYAALPLYNATSRRVLTAVTLQCWRAQGKVL